ncbi:MAG TPA: SDR family oxidoreductase [Pirellulales bacterium]|jgi:hypothetical protein
MFSYQGKTALVTGASSGIGAAFVHELAARQMKIILAARSTEALDLLAAEIRQRHQTEAHVINADLSLPNAAVALSQQVAKLELQVDLLINNAGFMTHGVFESIEPAREQAEIAVNVASMVGLTHEFLPGMIARREGAVINVASVAGFQPVPYLAVYAATKAFVISFSVALWEECRQHNVCVMALCPGTTATQLFVRAAAPEAALGKPRTSEQVVATALAGLDKRRSLVVDGMKNSLLSHGPRLIPRWFAARCAGNAVRPQQTTP